MARQEWIALTATAPLEPADPIWDRVRPPLNWLEEEDRIDEENHAHEEALAALVQALDDPGHIPPAELERLAHAVLQYGRGMSEGNSAALCRPATVRGSRSDAALASDRGRSGRRDHRGRQPDVSTLIRSWARASDASQAATAMLDMIELGEVEQASGFLEKLQKADAGLLSYPPLIEAREKLQAVQDKETDRIRAFDKTFRAAEQAPLTQLNPSELETARKLARQQTEKQAIEQLVQRRAAILEAERTKHEKDVGPRLDAVGRKIAEIQQQVETASDWQDRRFGNAGSARRRPARCSPTWVQTLPTLAITSKAGPAFSGQEIDAARTRLDQRRRKARLEEELTDAVAYSATSEAGKLVKFASGLDEYIKSFPDDPRSRGLQADAGGASTLVRRRGMEQAGGWLERSAQRIEPRRKPRSVPICAAGLWPSTPASPALAEVARYQRHLEAIARRKPADDSPITKLRLLLSDIFVNHIWMVTIRGRHAKGKAIIKRYYASKEPEEKRDYSRVQQHCLFRGQGAVTDDPQGQDHLSTGCRPSPRSPLSFKPILEDESHAGPDGKP